jgi:hypothetical protein
MRSVTVGGPGLVAVGVDHPNDTAGQCQGARCIDHRDDVAAVWTSPDGVNWSRVDHDAAVFGGAEMNSVTVGGPGLVAVGSDDSYAAAWTSVDGINWSRSPHDEAVLGGARDQVMLSVTAGGPGLVAVGEGSGTTPIWSSVDGVIWSRVSAFYEPSEMDQPDILLSVTVGGPGLVAVGDGQDEVGRRSTDAVVWSSVDGTNWLRTPHDQAVLGNADMIDVIAAGPGLIAVGSYDPREAASVNAAVWVSRG